MRLEFLLDSNYRKLQNDDIVIPLKEVIDNYDSEKNYNHIFLKKIIKVSLNVMQKDKVLSLDQIEKLYYISQNTIESIVNEECCVEDIFNKSVLIGHLYAHQGHLAKEMYYLQNKKQSWLQKSIESFKRAKETLVCINTDKNKEYLAWIHYHLGKNLYAQAKKQNSSKLARKAEQEFKRCKSYYEETKNETIKEILPRIESHLQQLIPLFKK